MVPRCVLALILTCTAATAAADPKADAHWYSGPAGHRRILHMSITAGAGLTLFAAQTVFEAKLEPDACRWCAPGTIDNAARDFTVWANTPTPDIASSIDAYTLAP